MNHCPCGRSAGLRRKCARCIDLTRFKTKTLRPSTKGRHARGITLGKPDKPRTRKAKRQNPQVMGRRPELRTSGL